jgi:high-affinity iron transporter
MFASALIVFRETLEAALFIGIVAAATRDLTARIRWIVAGVLGGVLGALLLAAAMERVSEMADGAGQDVLNAVFLSMALAMLAWHCIWISTHAREMVQHARNVSNQVHQQGQALWAIAIAVGVCVLREGAETVLFIGGIAASTQSDWQAMLAGASLGLLAGLGMGLLIYLGLTRIKVQYVFVVSNAFLLMLAGSLASQLAKVLAQAGWLNRGSEPLWDTSSALPEDSPPGMFLHALVGYDASPSALQMGFYLGAIAIIWLASRRVQAGVAPRARPALSSA